jgi:mannosyltransferase OCH1-like enzyme
MEYKTIPSYLPPRSDKKLLNSYKIMNSHGMKNQSAMLDLFCVIYYLNPRKIKVILRNCGSEGGWSQNIHISIQDLKNPKKYLTVSCGSSNYNCKKINIYLEKENNFISDNDENASFYIDYQKYDSSITSTSSYSFSTQLIPKTIIQTYENNEFHNIYHYNAVMTFLELNPEYTYKFFNDQDCYDYMKQNFSPEIFNAYTSLVPKAYQADLFRYCIIYKEGGCYFDNKYILRKPLDSFIKPIDKNVFCLDRFEGLMFNSIVISISNQDYLKNIIDRVVKNVQQKFYGRGPLHPTGPKLFYEYVKNENVIFQHMSKNPSNDYLNNFVSLIKSPSQIYFHKFYKGYYQNNTSKRYINYRKSKGSDYTQLWENRQIYQ